MRSWIETKWRGDAFFADRRAQAIDLLREALPNRDARWVYRQSMYGSFEILFALPYPPLAIAVDDDAWKSRRTRRRERIGIGQTGNWGFVLIMLSADAVLADVGTALDDALSKFC